MVEQIADQVESFIFAINNRRDVAVELLLARATQLRRRDILTGYLADNLRASDIHFRLLIDGNDEVRGHRRINGTAGRLAQHDGNLRAAARQRQLTTRNPSTSQGMSLRLEYARHRNPECR